MLQAPRKGFQRSVNRNNLKIEVLGDWIEANLLFFDDRISKSDVVDFLCEQEVCDDQAMAYEIADDGWSEIKRRKRIVGSPDDQLKIDKNGITAGSQWTTDPVRAFFLALSLFYAYPDWGKTHRNAPVQGLLFEKIVECIVKNIFPSWQTYRVGWSPEQPPSVYDIIRDLCLKLKCNGHPRLEDWVPDQAKDQGLDLVCFRNFLDGREAIPAYLLQCASGSNWREKVNTPDPNQWQKFLDAAVRPGTGIAAPFVIPTKKLKVAALQGQAIVLDRLRLLEGYYADESVLGEGLRTEITEWLEPFVSELPTLD